MKPTPAQRRDAQALLRKHYLEALELERQQLQQMLPGLGDAEDQLGNELDDWTEDRQEDGQIVTRFRPSAYKTALKAMTAVAVVAGLAVRKSLDDGADAAQQLAVRHAVVEIAHFSRVFDRVTDSDGLRQTLSDITTSGTGSLVDKFDTSAARYAHGVYEDLQERLADKIQSGARVSEMVDDLVRDGGPKGLVAVTGIAGDDAAVMEMIPEGLFARYRSRAETYVRTEIAGAYSRQTQDALEQTAEVMPSLQKRWCAEAGACDECEELDGQTIDVDDQFETEEGDTFDYPPAHPRCRCRHTPWVGDVQMASGLGEVDLLVDRES
jgi:SPP1 gp7 family putative phage head morphogenesis protein